MDSFLLPTCIYFRWKLNDSVHLFMYYFSIYIICIPLMGKVMQKLATARKSQQKCTYMFDYVFLSIYTGQNKGSEWQSYNEAAFSVLRRGVG